MLGAAAAAIQGQVGAASTYAGRVIGYSPDWYLPLGGSAATALIGAGGIYVHDLQLGVDSIAQDDPGGRSLGLSGLTTNAPHVTVSSPLVGPDLTIDLIFQPDSLTAKHVLITTLGGSVNGEFSVEVDAGGRPRAWSVEGGVAQVITGALEDVPQGEAVKITYQRQSNVPGWSQRFYVNGEMKAQDESQRTWAPVPAGTVFIGTWWDGEQFLAPTDGLIAHVAGWNRLLALVHIQDLVRTQSVAWAENIDAGSITSNASKIISVKEGGWHGKEPLVASAGDGALGTTTKSGPDITYMAGSPTGSNDTFTYFFDDASGHTTPTRSVTIDVVASQSEGLPTSIAEIESRSGRTVTKTVDVAGGAAFTSLQTALNAAVAGDVIAVRGGKYFGTISLTGKQGTSSNPIQVWGWHPDGVTAPTITTEVQNMPTWTLQNSSLGIYSATVPGANNFAYGYLPDSEGGWQLLHHFVSSTNFELTGERYTGPTMHCSGATVRVRTQTDLRQLNRLIPDGKYDIPSGGLPGEKNPNNWSEFRFSVTPGFGFQFSNCAHIQFNWLNWFGGQHGILLHNGTAGLHFKRGWLRYNHYGVLFGTPSDGSDPVATNCLIDHFDFRQKIAPWIARDDYKSDTSSNGATRSLDGFNQAAIYVRGGQGLEVAHCVFDHVSDIMQVAAGKPRDIWLHHCLGLGSRDDVLQMAADAYNVEFDHNIFLGFAGPGHGESGVAAPANKQAQVYIHHNIIDTGLAPYALGLISFGRNTSSGQANPFAYGNEKVRGSHNTPALPFPYRMWNNTYITRDQRATGSYLGWVYGEDVNRVPTTADRANELWNSIVVSPANSVLVGGTDGAGDVVDAHPSRSTGTPVCMMDGMMFARASGPNPLFRGVIKLQGGTVKANYASIADYKNQVGGTHFSASGSAKYPQAPQRWNGNSLQEDPQLNGGTLTSGITDVKDPAHYVPANPRCRDQGVNIAGRWNIAAPDGPRDRSGIESNRTRFYIGAIDPVDDPTGSDIGPQP